MCVVWYTGMHVVSLKRSSNKMAVNILYRNDMQHVYSCKMISSLIVICQSRRFSLLQQFGIADVFERTLYKANVNLDIRRT